MYLANAVRILGGEFPLAKYHTRNIDGVLIAAKPIGRWSGLSWIPYKSDTNIRFRVEIQYPRNVNSDFRNFIIRANDAIVTKVHADQNKADSWSADLRSPIEHDDSELIVTINFPNMGRSYRLLRSVPLHSNYAFLLVMPIVVGALIGAVFGATGTLILQNWQRVLDWIKALI